MPFNIQFKLLFNQFSIDIRLIMVSNNSACAEYCDRNQEWSYSKITDSCCICTLDGWGIIMYILNALILQMRHTDLFHFNFCCQMKVIIDTFSSKYFHLLTNIDTWQQKMVVLVLHIFFCVLNSFVLNLQMNACLLKFR